MVFLYISSLGVTKEKIHIANPLLIYWGSITNPKKFGTKALLLLLLLLLGYYNIVNVMD